MRPYIFAERNGIHIIDLAQTVKRLDVALDAARETVARGDSVLFVGTQKQAQEHVAGEALSLDLDRWGVRRRELGTRRFRRDGGRLGWTRCRSVTRPWPIAMPF